MAAINVAACLKTMRTARCNRNPTRRCRAAQISGVGMTQAASEKGLFQPGAPESFFDVNGKVSQGWRASLAALLALTAGPSTLVVMTFGVFAPFLAEEFKWSIASISVGGTVIGLMVMILAPTQGYLIDRFGARRMILLSIPLFGLGFAGIALIDGQLWQFYLAWVIVPVLGVGTWAGSFAKIASLWFDRRLGLAMGVVSVGTGIGAAIMPMIVGFISSHWGWRSGYVILGLGSILVTWPMAFLFIREPARRGVHTVAAESWVVGETLSQASKKAVFWKLSLGFLLLGFISTSIVMHQVNMLVSHGISRTSAIYLQSVMGFSIIIGRLFAGWLLDRAPVTRVMPLFSGSACIALALYALNVQGGVELICSVLLGLTVGAEFDVLGYVVRRYHGQRHYGTIYGAIFAAFQAGTAIGVGATGFMHSYFGSYTVALFLLSAVTGAATLIFTRLGPYRFAPLESEVNKRSKDVIVARQP
jgi:MFS family permease